MWTACAKPDGLEYICPGNRAGPVYVIGRLKDVHALWDDEIGIWLGRLDDNTSFGELVHPL